MEMVWRWYGDGYPRYLCIDRTLNLEDNLLHRTVRVGEAMVNGLAVTLCASAYLTLVSHSCRMLLTAIALPRRQRQPGSLGNIRRPSARFPGDSYA